MCEVLGEHYAYLHVQKCFPNVFVLRQTQMLLLTPHGVGGDGILAGKGNQELQPHGVPTHHFKS